MDRPIEAAVETCQPSQKSQTCHSAGLNTRTVTWQAIGLLVVLTVVLRVGGIERPLVGHFATKNAIYAMITRNWVEGRAPFWLPTTDCMAGGGRGWHLLEIPMAAYIAGAGWAVCGGSLDVWGRAISIAFSAAGVATLFLLTRRWHSAPAACSAALVLALSPASIIYGQSFMLESSVVFFMLATLWCTQTWLATARARWFVLSTLSLMLLLCTKIYMLVIFLPLAVFAARKIGTLQTGWRRWLLGCLSMAFIGLAPAAIWCVMAIRLSSPNSADSASVYYSLYRSTASYAVPNSLFTSASFYVRLLGNLAGTGLTPLGLLLAVVGAFTHSARRHAGWLAAMAVLVALLPGKFFELRYYTLVLVPVLAVLSGLGWEWLAPRVPTPRFSAAILLVIGVGCSLRLAIGPAFITPLEDRGVIAAATAMQELSVREEPVATLHGAGCDLLYYCDRPGWALSANDRQFSETLGRCRRQGARWLVVADLSSLERSSAAAGLAMLPVAREGKDYRVYRLCHNSPQRLVGR
jgi:4-amino-4-deoxy-L-arabinose transferase-like glycosyltransferase